MDIPVTPASKGVLIIIDTLLCIYDEVYEYIEINNINYLTTVMKSKHNKQGHGPLSHIKVLLLDCLGVVLGNVFSN